MLLVRPAQPSGKPTYNSGNLQNPWNAQFHALSFHEFGRLRCGIGPVEHRLVRCTRNLERGLDEFSFGLGM
jgi:hypothetical protein